MSGDEGGEDGASVQCAGLRKKGERGGGGKGTERGFPPLNVLMQPKATKHSILSTYIDTHRVVLTDDICSIKKLSA